MNYYHIARESLGFFPTPLVALSKLSKKLDGPTIFMKRDDNTGLALGGNKTRKLEFIIGDALAKGADTIVTAGAAQSNHCRQTAAAAASLGLECHLVLGGKEPAQASGNLLLDKIFGCHIHWAGANRKGEDIPDIVEQLITQGKKPYVVPYGGSNELGALAFVEAYKELESQRKSMSLSFTHIIFASSSGGTQAGLMLGKKAFNSPCQIVGINIDKGETDKVPFDQYTLSLANRTAKLIGASSDYVQALCNNNIMTQPIDELLRSAGVPLFDASDGTLSGGEAASASIVSALVAHWDRLDGQQQRALVSALEASTQATEEAEAFVWKQLDER